MHLVNNCRVLPIKDIIHVVPINILKTGCNSTPAPASRISLVLSQPPRLVHQYFEERRQILLNCIVSHG